MSTRYFGINHYSRKLLKKIAEENLKKEEEQRIIQNFLFFAEEILNRGKVPNRNGVLRTMRASAPYFTTR